jgi:hypothetical protein
MRDRMTAPLKPFVLLLICLLFSQAALAQTAPAPIVKLKKLYLDTVLVEKGAANAVIVVPAGGKYATEAVLLQRGIQKLSGVTVPLQGDDVPPEELLKTKNVLVLGNMATNRFIEKLYRQWRVILDLRYPGPGGYVVRSLHNPYATGRNVIFIGASNDAGVTEAAKVFVGGLRPGKTLKVGWLQKIRLGEGISPPAIGAYLKQWQVLSWNDSQRKLIDGRMVGYPPASYFGWNPISIAGILYYLTGREEYLQTFKELAMPDPLNLPFPNKNSDAFKDPANPLVKNYHYHAYLVDCIYDLIEESPSFSDKERLLITKKLREHQLDYEASQSFYYPNGDRHTLWQLLCIYTGSRYFSLYYPDPAWESRLAGVRRSFNSLIGNPTWGERDTLEWVPTSIQPVFEFFLLDGDGDFLKSGTARKMMDALEVLTTGRESDDYSFTDSVPISLLHQAAYLLKDDRYIWLARHHGFDLDAFRIGLSYWPSLPQDPAAPTDLVNAIVPVPLARSDWESSQTPVSLREGFQVLSYRTGLANTDDYFLLDGFEGLGRHPYQVNTLLRLRMFGGKEILSGYANDIAIWVNGMSGPGVARSAALKKYLAGEGFAYVHSEVPDMPGSRWARRIVYLKGFGTVVVDRVTPFEAGNFDIASYWQMAGGIRAQKPSRRIVASNGAGVVTADLPLEPLPDGKTLRGKTSRALSKDEPLTLATLFFSDASPRTISTLQEGRYLIGGARSALVGVGPLRSPELSYQADFAYLDSERIFLENATELVVDGSTVFQADGPTTLLWKVKEHSAVFSVSRATRVVLSTGGRRKELVVPPGESSSSQVPVAAETATHLAKVLQRLSPSERREQNSSETPQRNSWEPLWQRDFPGKISHLAAFAPSDGGGFWAVSQDKGGATLARLDSRGGLLGTSKLAGEVLSIWPAQGDTQRRSFALLAGLKDDSLVAVASDGSERWRVKSSLNSHFMIGERFDAPWFTDPRPPFNMSGVHSILAGDLWGTGREEIVLGRPCTVEFRNLDGSLRGSVPISWGTVSSLVLLPTPQESELLAGKNYAGIPSLSGIDGRYQNVGDARFVGLSPGFPDMHAWQQRGLAALQVADLDGDGKMEVVYTLSGHWNELRVYDSRQKPLWMKSFGPDKAGSGLMTALALVDFNGDGKTSIVAGTKNGWVHAFASDGSLRWRHYFPSGITCLLGGGPRHSLVVGCLDGTVTLLGASGKPTAVGGVRGAVQSFAFSVDGVLAGSANGQLAKFPYLK